MDDSLCFELVVIFNFVKKNKFELSQFSLIQIMVTVGLSIFSSTISMNNQLD